MTEHFSRFPGQTPDTGPSMMFKGLRWSWLTMLWWRMRAERPGWRGRVLIAVSDWLLRRFPAKSEQNRGASNG